jgi:hypothetical protein
MSGARNFDTKTMMLIEQDKKLSIEQFSGSSKFQHWLLITLW